MRKLIILIIGALFILSCKKADRIENYKIILKQPDNQPKDSLERKSINLLEYSLSFPKTKTTSFFEKRKRYHKEYDSLISILNKQNSKDNSWLITHYPIDSIYKTNIIKNTSYDFLYLSYKHDSIYQSDFYTKKEKLYRFKRKHSEGFGTSRIDFIVKNLDTKDTIISQSHYCNKIDFEFGFPYYYAINYGCCSAPKKINKYNYKGIQVSETYSNFLNLSYDNNYDNQTQIGLTIREEEFDNEYLLIFHHNINNIDSNQYVRIKFKKRVNMFLDPFEETPLFKSSINHETFEYNTNLSLKKGADLKIAIPSQYGNIIIPIINRKPFGKDDKEIILTIK